MGVEEAAARTREWNPSAEVWRVGGIMTAAREFPSRDRSEVASVSGGTERDLAGGGSPEVKNPT